MEHYLKTKTGRNLFSRKAGAEEPHQGQTEQLCVFLYESIIYVNTLIKPDRQIQGVYIWTV